MTMQELSKKTSEELEKLSLIMAERGNMMALGLIAEVIKWRGQRVKVVKGRKVPKGTEGTVFWLGSFDNSKYGDPWGIYTTVKVGFKNDSGEVFFTSVENLELITEPER